MMISTRPTKNLFFRFMILVNICFVTLKADHSEDAEEYSDPQTVLGCEQRYRTYSIHSTTNKTGFITSPNFQSNCPYDVVLEFNFVGTTKERVQIIFTDVQFESEDQETGLFPCSDGDSIQLSMRPEIGSQEVEIAKYCGKKKPPSWMSVGNRMKVEYIRRSSTTKAGIAFNATYNFTTDFGIHTGMQITNNPDIACMFEYHSEYTSNGTFTSPNFPGLYPRNTECHYIFHGKHDEKINIKFTYFDVEGTQPGCSDENNSDYVELSNFNIPLVDRKMQRLCGKLTDVRKEINSDGDFFRVSFRTSESFDGTGFHAVYQFKQIKEQLTPPTKEKTFTSGGESTTSWKHVGVFTLSLVVAAAVAHLQ